MSIRIVNASGYDLRVVVTREKHTAFLTNANGNISVEATLTGGTAAAGGGFSRERNKQFVPDFNGLIPRGAHDCAEVVDLPIETPMSYASVWAHVPRKSRRRRCTIRDGRWAVGCVGE